MFVTCVGEAMTDNGRCLFCCCMGVLSSCGRLNDNMGDSPWSGVSRLNDMRCGRTSIDMERAMFRRHIVRLV